MASFVLYLLALVGAVVIAAVGMDFSPSFTAMFLVGFLALTVLAELCSHLEKKRGSRILALLGHFLLALGALLVLVSTYMYANGDDWLTASVYIALAAAAALHIGIYLFFYRRMHRTMGVGAGIENCLLLAAGLFALACAVPSTALWPCGVGVLLIQAARRLGEEQTHVRFQRGMMAAGMLMCAVFLVAPMMF